MPGRRKRHGREILWGIFLFGLIVVIAAFGEIIAHIFTFVFLALIPVAYITGVRVERYRNTYKLRSNTGYGRAARVIETDAVSAYPPEVYPPDVPPDHLERSRLLSDPRSGARPL